MANCVCQTPPFHDTSYDTVELGEDAHGAEVSLSTCKACGQAWLTYLIEQPHYSRSGRWWRVAVPTGGAASVTTATAREFIEAQRECIVGGSYFNSTGRRVAAPIRIA